MSLFKFVIRQSKQKSNKIFRDGLKKMKKGDYFGAIRSLNKVIQEDPSCEAYHNRATALFHLERYEEAIQDYQEAIALEPELSEAYLALGVVHTRLEQYEEAIDFYSQAIQAAPRKEMGYTNRGHVYFKLGQYADALQDFNHAISCNRRNAMAYHNRGAVYHEMGIHEKALENWTKGKKLGFAPSGEMLKRYQFQFSSL